MRRKQIVAAVLAALAGVALVAAPQSSDALALHQLTPDVFWVKSGGGNSGIVIGSTGVIVIDPQPSLAAVQGLRAIVYSVSRRPITNVILTHGDADQANGLAAFPSGVHLILHEGAQAEMAAALAKAGGPAAHMPVQAIAGTGERLTLDGQTIDVHHWAPAETSGDLVVSLPAQRIVFTGDLIVTDLPDPVIDLARHGSSAGWITSVQGLLGLDADRFVPGRGDLQTKPQVEARLTATTEQRARIAALVSDGKSLDEIRTAVGDPAPAAGRAGRGARGGGEPASFTEVVYRELTGGGR